MLQPEVLVLAKYSADRIRFTCNSSTYSHSYDFRTSIDQISWAYKHYVDTAIIDYFRQSSPNNTRELPGGYGGPRVVVEVPILIFRRLHTGTLALLFKCTVC